MNNILSDLTIEKINNGDLTQIKKLFDEVSKDDIFAKRQNQQLGVDGRLKLIPAKTHLPFGREATGVPVFTRPQSKGLTSDNELNMKSHKDYPNIISNSKSGYLSGIEVVSENTVALDKVNTFMKANTFEATHVDLVGSTCAYGAKAIRLFTDKITGITTYTEYEPWDYAAFYDKTGRLVGVMQWENTTEEIRNTYSVGQFKVNYINENEDMFFFTDTTNKLLKPNTQDYPALVVDGTEINQAGQMPHTYNGVPVVEFFNNSERLGDVEKTLDSQDARDELVSKASTTFSAFADVILNDKTKDEDGAAEIDKEEFNKMVRQLRDYGMLAGDWAWLVKDYKGYEMLSKHMIMLEQDIFESSSSYNPNSLGSDGANATAYQIRQKLKPLIDSSVNTEMEFKKSYRELFRLVLTQGLSTDNNMDYLDLNVIFNHNVPEDKIATLKQLKESGVTVPPELAYVTAGFKWEEVEPMIEEERKRVLAGLTDEEE
jgi:SPP1 family phage portal protein